MLLTHLSVFRHNKSVSVFLSINCQSHHFLLFASRGKEKNEILFFSPDCYKKKLLQPGTQQYLLQPPCEVKVLSVMFDICPPEPHFHVFARVLVTNAGMVYLSGIWRIKLQI